MAYMDVLSKLPEDATIKKVNVAKVTNGLNSGKDMAFFEDFFVSLGQNCKKADKGIKAGPLFINQTQVKSSINILISKRSFLLFKVKTIKSKGVLTKKDICNEDIALAKEAEIEKAKLSEAINKEKSKDTENNVVAEPSNNENDDIVMLDDDDDDGNDNNVEVMKDVEEGSTDVAEAVLDTILDDATAQAKSLFEKYSASQLRTFLKQLLKLIDGSGSVGIPEISGECKLSETETRALASEITRRCRNSPSIEGGKKQSFKVQNIFLNSQTVGKIAAFNFQ